MYIYVSIQTYLTLSLGTYNNPISMTQHEQQPPQRQYFCYLYVQYYGQAWVVLLLVLVIVPVMMLTWRQFSKAQKLGKINSTIRSIYWHILALCSFFIIEIILSSIFFWQEYIAAPPQPQISQRNQFLSRYLLLLQFLQQFFFQTILLLVCYNWLMNTFVIFNRILGGQQARACLSRQIVLLKVVNYTIYVRFLDFVILALILIYNNPTILDKLVHVVMGVFIAQQFIIVGCTLMLMYLIVKNNKFKQLVQWQSVRSMIVHYGWLCITVVGNEAWNLYYQFQVLDNTQAILSDSCRINQQQSQDWSKVKLFQICFFVVLYLIVVVVVLRLYKVDQKQNINGQSQNLMDKNKSINQDDHITVQSNKNNKEAQENQNKNS